MLMTFKFKFKKEAERFCYDKLPIITHMHKGHRGWVVKWHANLAAIKDEDEVTKLNADGKPRMSTEELHKQIIELHKDGSRIAAVKLVRIELNCGLREALDYCNKIWNA